MTKKLSLIIFLALTLLMEVKAQNEDPELPNIVPPSPTAYELGKYGQIEVGMFTGTPNVNVPLYTYRTKNLAVPISLSYGSNGIKVDQMATWVGLGWSMNSGGVITRIIRDLPDERFGIKEPPRELTQTNQLDTDIQDFAILAEDAASDTERDQYMFNFNGYSGRFTITDLAQKELIISPDQALKITYTDLSSVSSRFEITTPDGIQYIFEDHEESNGTGGCSPSDNLYPITAWYLSQIVHPSGDIINFVYASEIYSYQVGTVQSFSKNKNLLGGGCNGGPDCPDLTTSTPCLIYSSIRGKRLIEINSPDPSYGKLVFTKGVRNPDLPVGPSYGNQYLLDNIQLRASDNSLVERYDFDYQLEKKRMFLKSVTFLDPSKSYDFEYNSPSLLPDRLDYGQDYWGYYNGKVNSVFYPKVLEEPLLANIGADRAPSGTHTRYGLLKKVIYPTKGFTELEYEPNIVQEMNAIVYDTENVSFELQNATDSFTFTASADVASQIEGTLSLRIFEQSGTPCTGIPDFFDDTPNNSIWFRAQLFDVTANAPVIFNNTGTASLQSNQPFSPKEGTITLQPNHEYRLDLEKGNTCIYGIANLNYVTSDNSQVLVDREIGGVRLRKRTNKASATATPEIIRYYYGTKENLNGSSASSGNKGYYLNDKTVQLLCTVGNIGVYAYNCEYTQVNSNSVVPLFNTNDNKPIYEYVTVSHGGDDFENGGEEYHYMVERDAKGETVFSRYAYIADNSSFSNTAWNNGLLKYRTSFKKNTNGSFVVLDSVINFYKNDVRNFNQNINYKVIKRHEVVVYYNNNYPTDQIDIIKYRDNSYWHYLDSTVTTRFDTNGQNPVIQVTKNHYDNPTHLQLTRTESTNSRGQTIETETIYPDDVANTGSLGLPELSGPQNTAIGRLKRGGDLHRVAEPVQTVTTVKNGNTVVSKSTQRTLYRDWGNDLVQPDSILTLKGDYSATNKMQHRISFHDYDDKGNVNRLSKANGPSIVYIWGYAGAYPIAKIENATHAQIAVALGTTEAAVKAFDETDLATIDGLRSSLPTAMVTTYTYDPLIGVTSITDPRGYTTHYTYDGFNRLKEVKDAESLLIEDYQYQYKTQD